MLVLAVLRELQPQLVARGSETWVSERRERSTQTPRAADPGRGCSSGRAPRRWSGAVRRRLARCGAASWPAELTRGHNQVARREALRRGLSLRLSRAGAAMSAAGPAAALALKTQSRVSAGDNDLAGNAAAGQALRAQQAAAAAVAAAAPAAAAAGPARPAPKRVYNFPEMRIVGASLPAQSVGGSSAGRPRQPAGATYTLAMEA